MCTQYFHTKEEQDELLKDLPEVIKMYKLVQVTGDRMGPVFYSHAYLEYTKGVNIAPICKTTGLDSKGFHCFFSKDDAKLYRWAMGLGSYFRVIEVYVNKPDILFTGRDMRDADIAIVSQLEIK